MGAKNNNTLRLFVDLLCVPACHPPPPFSFVMFAYYARQSQTVARMWCRILTHARPVPGRHAWCCLRDAGERAGMRRVLKERPWGNPREPLEGAKEAVGSDVLKVGEGGGGGGGGKRC